MLPLLADEDFDNRVVRGALRQEPALDILRAQDVGLDGRDDAIVLEYAAAKGRAVLTRDVRTMTVAAWDRVAAELPMPGVFAVPASLSLVEAISAVVLLAVCSHEGEWEGQVRFLPL